MKRKMTEMGVAPLIAFGMATLLSSGLRVLKAFREQRLLTGSAVVDTLFRVLVSAKDRWLKEKVRRTV